jgi:formate dehydrogenase subunit delta
VSGTSSGVDNLVKMANNIEAFFRAEPDRDTAVSGIESHLRRFWDPRMRKAIVAHVQAGGAGLGELVTLAVQKLAR